MLVYTTLHYTTIHYSTLQYITLHSLHHHKCHCNYTTLIVHYTTTTTPLHYSYSYSCTTSHYIQQLSVRWPLQPLQPLQKTQLQPPFSPSVDSLCHPSFTTTKLFYRFLILKLPPQPCAALLVDIQDTFGSNLCDRKTHIGLDDFQEFISWPFLACTLQSSLAMCGSKPHIFVGFACHLAANLVISKFWTVESWSFLGMNLSNFVCFSIVKLKKWPIPIFIGQCTRCSRKKMLRRMGMEPVKVLADSDFGLAVSFIRFSPNSDDGLNWVILSHLIFPVGFVFHTTGNMVSNIFSSIFPEKKLEHDGTTIKFHEIFRTLLKRTTSRTRSWEWIPGAQNVRFFWGELSVGLVPQNLGPKKEIGQFYVFFIGKYCWENDQKWDCGQLLSF